VSRADTDWGTSIFCTSSVGGIALCFCCYDLSSKIHLGVFPALREISYLYKRLGVGLPKAGSQLVDVQCGNPMKLRKQIFAVSIDRSTLNDTAFLLVV
jgi:hypothetical protein